MLKTVQFHLLDDGTLDCWFQYEGGATTSFDPAQLPDSLAEVLGPVLTAALAKVAKMEAPVLEVNPGAIIP